MVKCEKEEGASENTRSFVLLRQHSFLFGLKVASELRQDQRSAIALNEFRKGKVRAKAKLLEMSRFKSTV